MAQAPAGRRRRHRSSAAWVPRQHGAWAMLIVPSTVGAVLGVRAGTTGVAASVSLGLAAVAAYLCFNAVGLWVKAPPARRAPFQTAALVYLAVTVVLGLASVAAAGLALLAWVPAFAVLAAGGLLLVRRHRERSVLSGATTVGA
ncbi:MAG: YwiC-like family protein, partial [Actinomycetia bacterium]|nr:YwiC-like family protein [Actinomycetes bacterium]